MKNPIFKIILIYLRSTSTILLTTSNIYFISNKMYIYAILVSAGISLFWTLNVKDLAISNWVDRLMYIFGGMTGTAISLTLLETILKH